MIKKTILFGLMSGISFSLLWGSPAIKSPVQTMLPDNTTLTVFLHGDEFFNYRTTKDGYVIVKDKQGFYEYALSNDEGHFVSSGVKTHDSTARSKKEEQFLSSLPKGLSETSKKWAQENRAKRVTEFRSSAATQDFPTLGNMKALILLVEYQDVKFTYSNERMDRFFNQAGYSDDGAGGSAKDFFESSSFDQYQPEFVVVGPITLPNNRAYYGGENKPAWQMVTHGCEIAKREGLDFSQFDANNDGEIDVVYCLFAGYDRAQGGGDDCVWSHASGIIGVSHDGKRLGKYACSSELRGNSGNTLVGCGTFCHEFGHVLGLPDMYETDDTANGDCQTPDSWTTMASGGYNNYGKHPPLYSSYERHILNWIHLDNAVLNQPGEYELLPLITSNQAYKIETKTPGDFYVFEYRRKTGFDAYLADEGLLVWHIDRSNTPIRYNNATTTPAELWNRGAINNIGGHPLYDIVESTPIAVNANTPGNRNVVFPGGAGKTSLTDSSYPNMKSWAEENTEKPVTNIRVASGKVLFDFIAPPDITNNGGTITAEYDIKTDDPASDPALLIDNNANTYYSRLVARASSYWVQYQSTEAAVVTAYNLTSSNGQADRDPRSWTLKASNDEETWITLDTRTGEAFTGRKQLNAYKFENETPYLYYRLEITEMNGSIGVQLSEWELLGYTQPAAPTEINAQWNRHNQQVKLNWTDNSMGETAFEIERSEEDAPYEFLYLASANQSEFIDNTAQAFKKYTYRLRTVMPGLHSVWAESEDICTDINLAGNTGGTASAEYEVKETDPKSDPQYLFDANTHTTYYRSIARANSYWVQYQSNLPVVVSSYAITSGDAPAYNPRNWTFSASTDGENWTVLDSREEQFFSGIESKNYLVNAPEAYSYFRLNVTKINDSKALQIAEWEIIGHVATNTLAPTVQSADNLSVSTTVSATRPWIITNIGQYPENEVNIYNLSGIKVFSSRRYANNWTGKSLPRGVYIYEVKPGNGKAIERGRLLKINE